MKFFEKIKEIIKKAAQEAVFEAEKTFGSGSGAAKKEAAIAFVVDALPFAPFWRPIISAVLRSFIDSTIEAAVAKLKAKGSSTP